MGTAVLMEKLGLELTVHDITYVYRLQATGRNQYTLVARNSDRKLVTGLPDSSKGRDEDFLVITGNWQNPLINCPLIPGELDKEFTAKNVDFVERRTIEHLLKRLCFIDSSGCPRSAPSLLDYVPSYKSFQKGPTVKDLRQVGVTVSRPRRDQEKIIQAVPLTARRGVQIPQLVTPLIDPNFVPSTQSSEVRLSIIRFPSLFDPNPNPTVRDLSFPPSPGVLLEDTVMKKRKRGEEEADEAGDQQALPPLEPSKAKSLTKKERAKMAELFKRPQVMFPTNISTEMTRKSRGVVADVVGRALLLPKDMKIWQEKRSEHMVENLKRDSILVVQGIFKAGSRLLETERLLNQSLVENDRLRDLEKSAFARIQATESKHKSAEAGLMTAKRQVVELTAKLDREIDRACELQAEIGELKTEVNEARAAVQKAEDEAQSYYDQGFDEAASSLKS
uniref:Uncharacterized protein n=1 Tax=Fagus sylvatica TaxID=28930 RepID=A0A2N9IWI5_FAGSY